MEPTDYIYPTLEEANAFIAIVNAGEGYPVEGRDTQTYCEAMPIEVDGEITGWSVLKDNVTEKYHS